MSENYINIYNNLVNFSRNKKLFNIFTKKDTFSDRLIILLIHLGFFIKNYKSDISKEEMQQIYDYVFRQLELSIREIGYGDASINKKMKDYINVFHSMLEKIETWDSLSDTNKDKYLKNYLNYNVNFKDLSTYFNKFSIFLSNKPFNLFTKGVIKSEF